MLLALGNYQERSSEFIKGAWDQILSFHCFTKTGKDYDGTFFLEVDGEESVSGREHTLKRLGLSLPYKGADLPC